MDNRVIILNSMRTPDGTVLTSQHRHDYKEYKDKNGKVYIIDGGKDYLRRSANGDEVDLSVFYDAPHAEVREHFVWGRKYNEKMERLSEVEYIKLKDITDGHLEALVSFTAEGYPAYVNPLFRAEYLYRESLRGLG